MKQFLFAVSIAVGIASSTNSLAAQGQGTSQLIPRTADAADGELFFQSVVQGHLVDLCRQLAPELASKLGTARQKWLDDRAQRLTNGRAYSLKVMEEQGTTEQKSSDDLRDSIVARAEPQFRQDPQASCVRVLSAIEEMPIAPSPSAANPTVDATIYVQSMLHEDQVATCSRLRPSLTSRLSSALQGWLREMAQPIERGRIYALEHRKQYGTTADAQRKWAHDTFASQSEPEITAEPDKQCEAVANVLEGGFPVPLHGATLADRTLRIDIYRQAQVAASCLKTDSIDITVLQRTPTFIGERWVLQGCGKKVPMTVSITPGSAGTTNFAIKLDRAANPTGE